MMDKKKHMPLIAFVMTFFVLISSIMPVMAAEGSVLPHAAFAGTDTEWEALREQAKNRQRNVIYDNDGDDAAAFPNGKEPSIENILALRTSFLNKYPVDNITYTITRGGFDHLLTPTTKGEPFYADVPAYQNLTKWLHDQGTDALKLQINYARENNKEIFAQIRVNDAQHDAADRGPDNPQPLFSPFKRQHPELLLGANYYMPDGINQGHRIGHWSGYNFGMEAVRNRFYDVADEILTNYASDDKGLDGITLNFHRDGVLFKSMADGNDVTQEERDAWTALLKRIRDRAEEIGKMRGRPILIAVKVPDSVAYSKAAGIDLTEWLNQKLVDLVIGGLHVDPWGDMVALCHHNGVKYYATVEPEFYYPESGAIGSGGGIPLKRNVNERYYAQILAAKKAGVDGIEFFNMFYENQVRDIMSIVTEEELAYKNKRFFPTPYVSPFQEFWLKNGNSYSEKLSRLTLETPILVLPEVGNELVLEVGDNLQEANAAGVNVDVKVAIYGKIPKPEDLILKIGTHPLTYLESADNNVHFYSVPADALSVGLNRITLSMSDSGSQAMMPEMIMKGDAQLTAAYRPWRRMLMPGQGGGEAIVNGTLRITDPGADGRPSLHYPLADFPGGYTENNPFLANFSVKVESASEERAVVFYVADGRYVTEVSFMPGKVSFMGTTESYDMNTTDTMHKYQLKITDTKAFLYVDGGAAPILETTLSEERKVFSSNEMMFMDKTDLVGNVDRHGLLFGSLSYEGSSKAYWKDIEIVRPENSAWISDMYLQIQYGGEQMKPRELANDWQYANVASGEGIWTLAAGNWTWQLPYMAAEVELEVASGEAEITFSNGGELIQQIVAPQTTRFNPAATRPSWAAESGDTRRVEIGTGTNAENRFYSSSSPDRSVVTGSKLNVTQWLKDNEGLYPAGSAAYNVIRNGGVLVRKLSAESQVTVKAIRASIGNNWLYKTIPAGGITLFEDNGADLSTKGWTQTIPANMKMYIVDSKGKPGNTMVEHTPEAGQYLVFQDEQNLAGFANSNIRKNVTIGAGAWTLEFDAKIKELIQTPNANKEWLGFTVDVHAGGRRWKVNFLDQNKIRVVNAGFSGTMTPAIELEIPENDFHKYTLHYDGNGKLSIGRDDIMLGTYDNVGHSMPGEPDQIYFSSMGGAGVTGKNEVYLDNIALYKGRAPVWKQMATVMMSDGTVTYNGEPHTLVAAIAPTGKMMEYRYKGIGSTEYAESPMAPVRAGTYEVTARIVDTKYTGSAKAVLTIEKARPKAEGVTGTLLKGQTLADASLSGVFNGVKNEQLTGTITWGDGDEFVPAEAGEFAYTFTPSSPDYLPVTGIMTVNVNSIYTITYDANGGEGAMTESTGISSGTSGAVITLPANGFTPPEGMKFKKWAIGSIDGEKANAGSTYTFTANTIVYAIWEDSTPPALPVITANTEVPVVTGVTITIVYPPDAAIKQVKIGEGDMWTDYAGPFAMTVNDSVYARAVDAAGNVSGIAAYTVGNIAGELSVSRAKPGKPVLSSDNGYDTGLQDGSYTITMNMYYGDNGRIYRLYENDALIETRVIADHTPNAQRTETVVAGKSNGTYLYYAELTNSYGTTRSDTLTVVVTQAAPAKPVLSNDNWDGDGNFQVTMDMWWGTNGEMYHLYENDVLIASIPLAEHTPGAQTATVTLTGRQRGTYEYRGELVNYAGAVSSDTMTVRVTK